MGIPDENPAAGAGERISLGEVSIRNKEAFDLDLKINDGYQAYSAELLRVALFILTGLSAVWLRLFVGGTQPLPKPLPFPNKVCLALSFVAIALAGAAALFHRYAAADSLACQLEALRRKARNYAGDKAHAADADLAHRQFASRNLWFNVADWALRISMSCIVLGLFLFCYAMTGLMFV